MRRSDRLFYIVLSVVYVLLLCLVARNLDVASLWYDEAGQFFLAKGLNHCSEPYSPEGGISDVLYNNSYYNFDPGGYTLVLHFWTMVSSNHVWLRLLSFLFFIGGLVFTILSIRKITANTRLAVISGLFVFALPYAAMPFELRGYSMELCGLAYCLWLMYRLKEKLSLRRVLIGSIIMSVFISARYTMLVFGFVYSCFILVDILTGTSDKRDKFIYTAALSLPLLIVVTLIYFLELRIQNVHLEPLFYIKYFPGRRTFLFFCIFTIGILCFWKLYTDKVRRFVLLFLVANILFVVLSLAEMLPWCFDGKRGQPFVWLLYMMGSLTAVSILGRRAVTPVWSWLMFVICIGVIVVTDRGVPMLRRTAYQYPDMVPLLYDLPGDKDDIVYVSDWKAPGVRYLYEYGVLKEYASKNGYPDRFVQFISCPHAKSAKKFNNERRDSVTLATAPVGTLYIKDSGVYCCTGNGYEKIR